MTSSISKKKNDLVTYYVISVWESNPAGAFEFGSLPTNVQECVFTGIRTEKLECNVSNSSIYEKAQVDG